MKRLRKRVYAVKHLHPCSVSWFQEETKLTFTYTSFKLFWLYHGHKLIWYFIISTKETNYIQWNLVYKFPSIQNNNKFAI